MRIIFPHQVPQSHRPNLISYINNTVIVMKTLQPLMVVFLLISLLIACQNDDQVLGNRVAGQWTLARIRYANPNRPGVDTTLSLQGSSITFDACQFKRGEALQCTGQHQVFNSSLIPFKFTIDGLKQQSMSINQSSDVSKQKDGDLYLNGGYDISFGDGDNQMELKGRFLTLGSTKVLDETAYFTLKRKQ